MDGILNICKQEGPTSFGTVAAVKRLTGVKKVGHAGTLDPAASGVLPICLGRATRVTEYLMEYPKTYRAEVEFGKTTDTSDREGRVLTETDPSGVTLERISFALVDFRGEIQQKPPLYSALKHEGQPYYKLARAGQEIEIESRPVMVYSIEIIDWKLPVVTLDIECGKGTYIRSLARDLGEKLGCGAYMKSLVRRKYGPFSIEDAVTIPELEQAVRDNDWQRFLHPADSVLQHLKALTVTGEEIVAGLKNGHSFTAENIASPSGDDDESHTDEVIDNRFRVYAQDDTFLGIYRYIAETELYQPVKVFLR